MNAREMFRQLTAVAREALASGERFALSFEGERSTFVRFNRARVRQPTDLLQLKARLDLRAGKRHALGEITLTGAADEDRARLRALFADLRAALPQLPEDPYLLEGEPIETARVDEDRLPDPGEVVDAVVAEGEGLDLVGIYAAGGVFRGYSCDRGSDCWFESHPFHLELSAYLEADKATKHSLAGFAFSRQELAAKLAEARRDLDILARPAKVLEPGAYRAYLTPAAVFELVELLGWGFGKKALETKASPLLALALGEARFDERVSFTEDTARGAGPGFSSAGFVKPERVELVTGGRLTGALTSPRSAEEYGVPHNGAEDNEAPTSLAMAPGALKVSDAAAALDEGLYVSNLWYANFSDKKSCRVTGMTRFATLWVEGGEVVAPVNVMRFDDSLYRVFGEGLEALTDEAGLVLDAGTYFKRSTGSARLPGALVNRFNLTL